ncbi:MAG: CoA-binding protein, partial [Pseudomonadota bacterium]
MSIRNLEGFFQPQTVAVVGASERPGSVGQRVFSNLLNSGFEGDIIAINPAHSEVLGRPALPHVDQMQRAPDLAVVATPPHALIGVLESLGEIGCRAAMILTVMPPQDEGAAVNPNALLGVAGRYKMRLLGPGCVGLTVPALGLNASMVIEPLATGSLAFVSQSSGMAMAVQHWALERSIGFSNFLSLGDGLDVDLSDLIDYLAIDSRTRAILVAQTDVERGRKTLSALRAAARIKPVVVLKIDQHLESPVFPNTEAALEIQANRVRWKRQAFDAALRRSGAVRVEGFDDLFSTAELLAHTQSIGGPRLAVISNSNGAGLLTRDALARADGLWPDFGAELDGELAERFPSAMAHRGLLNLGRWASAEDLVFAIQQLSESGAVDAIVLTLTPNLVSDLDSLAKTVIEGVGKPSLPILGCLLGGEGARDAAQRFAAADWPSFLSPEEVVSAVAQLEDYRCNQQSLTELPESDPEDAQLDLELVRAIVLRGQSQGVRRLDEVRSKQILA